MSKDQTHEDSFLKETAELITAGPVMVLVAFMNHDYPEQCKRDLAGFGPALLAAVELGRFGPLFEGAVEELRQDFSHWFKRVHDELAEPLKGLSKLAAATVVLPPEKAGPYVNGLLYIGETLVKGSGGFLSAERKRKKQCLREFRRILQG